MKRYGKAAYSRNGRGLRDRVSPNHRQARTLERDLRKGLTGDLRLLALTRDGQVAYSTRGARS